MKLSFNSLFIVINLLLFFLSSCKKDDDIPKIAIEPSSLTMTVGQYTNTKLTVKYNGVEIMPEEVIWNSKDTSIAKMGKTGFVYGIWTGETDVTATLVNGKGFASCKIIVYDEHSYKFRLILRDKGTSSYSINRPSEFLSLKAIARRTKQNLQIDETDLPISPEYINKIEQIGGVIVAKSKWLKTVTVYFTDVALLDKYKQLPFVENTFMVWMGDEIAKKSTKEITQNLRSSNGILNKHENDSAYYGSAWININKNKGQVLHELGYRGAGIDIAVIDDAFLGIKSNPTLSNINIKGAKSFIYESKNPFETYSHGVWVTSCMATNKPGYYVGTAPEANYWLMRTEDSSSEYPIEQDYWVAAIEYADSVGVDVVNTSLYYTFSQFPPYKYNWENMDGKTEMASRGANMAAGKGIFIVCCAGNELSWVGTPGDSPNVLTVGAIGASNGITVDGRIKPDIISFSLWAQVIDINGDASLRIGTSYSSPIICGLAACLWQAYPMLTNKELMEIIKKSADQYNNPQLPFGYGIPNMERALQLSKQKYIEMEYSLFD